MRADWNDDVLCCQCIRHILCAQTQRLQFRQLEVNLYQTHLATVRKRNGCTRYRDQRSAHQVQAVVSQILFRQAFAGQGQLQNRHRRGVVVDDQRWQRARRHLPEHGLRNGRHLRIGGCNVHAGVEENFDNAQAVIRIRFQVFDVIDRGGQHAFIQSGHATGHLVRRQACIGPGHSNHGDADFRKNVCRCFEGCQRTHDQQQQGHHDKRIRALKRQTYNIERHR